MVKRVVRTPFPAGRLLQDSITLGKAVRAGRTEAGFTIEEAAMFLGLSKHTLSDLETGKPSVSLGTALKICAAFGVSIFMAPTGERERVLRALAKVSS